MTDLREKFPDHDQYALLTSHGFGDAFGGLWLERDDLDEIVRLLGADPPARRDATLADAMSGTSGDVPEGLVWVGPHTPGWSAVINLAPVGGAPMNLQMLSGRRRGLEVSWLMDVDGLYGLDWYEEDGHVEELPAFWGGHLEEGSVFRPYVSGLVRDYADDGGDEPLAHTCLTVAGRITGRFLDEAWFHTPGRVYELP
ncbi:hypothetical protein [Herbidospora sp. RD11066]